jgi:ribose transport system substrate-binding protein
MIKKTRFVIIYLVFIFLFFLSSCCNREQLNTLQKERNIALIVKMQNGDYWNTVKMGADAAAKEFNINLAFMAPNDEEDVDGQIQLVNQAIDQKVDALILAASDYDALTQVTEKAYSEGIPVIIIDAEVNTDKIVSYIATDNYAAGKKAGKKLIEVTGDNCKVAIMSFVKGAKNAVQRETGLISITAQCPEIEIVA